MLINIMLYITGYINIVIISYHCYPVLLTHHPSTAVLLTHPRLRHLRPQGKEVHSFGESSQLYAAVQELLQGPVEGGEGRGEMSGGYATFLTNDHG